MNKKTVLIIDHENLVCWSLAKMLKKRSCSVEIANTGRDGLLRAMHCQPDLVILDAALPDVDGLDLLEELKDNIPELPVIVMTSSYHSNLAFQAFKLGATDYVGKPFNIDMIEKAIEKIFSRQDTAQDVQPSRSKLRKKYEPDQLVGNCPSMVELFKTINLCAQNDCKTILVLGESGTGKELVTHAIHDQSARRDAPLVEVNCASIPDNLLENELFGHEKGAYTDAGSREIGVFEAAEGGTVFLDEIGDMPLNMQAKILKVIENRKFRRLGGQNDIATNVRIIAATNQDLNAMVQDGRFRGDLFYRLNMMCISLKPLRERKKCIPSMVEYFIDRLNGEYGRAVAGISSEALRMLMAHNWPGNVRELRNAIERAMMLEQGKIISTDHICIYPGAENARNGGCVFGCNMSAESAIVLPPEGISLEEVEKEYIKQALARYEGNQTKAAKCLGLSIDTLRYRRKKFGLDNYPAKTSPISAPADQKTSRDAQQAVPG
ncbi:MAG: sigma-54-dependent Fis family transcriptional regulator [Desulfuromonadales bacterium]|nr:sigma-54-dependent Fis family transcriptional regulator [Desulfuromonadales bacterium]MBN2792993.1 sigma-54-dependent Fis family transcriptional regulator [Desulfuromonadales bacterium]